MWKNAISWFLHAQLVQYNVLAKKIAWFLFNRNKLVYRSQSDMIMISELIQTILTIWTLIFLRNLNNLVKVSLLREESEIVQWPFLRTYCFWPKTQQRADRAISSRSIIATLSRQTETNCWSLLRNLRPSLTLSSVGLPPSPPILSSGLK